MTPPKDTTPGRRRHEAALDRLRARGNHLAPVMVDGRVRPKGSSKAPAVRGAGRGVAALQPPSEVITRLDEVRPAEDESKRIPGTVFEFVIPAPAEFLNANRDNKLHWAEKGRLVKAWRRAGVMAARRAELPRGLQRVRVDAYVIKPRRNLYDPANFGNTAKAASDGFVTDHGLCPDDNLNHVEGPFMHDGGKGEPALRVVVTVLEVMAA